MADTGRQISFRASESLHTEIDWRSRTRQPGRVRTGPTGMRGGTVRDDEEGLLGFYEIQKRQVRQKITDARIYELLADVAQDVTPGRYAYTRLIPEVESAITLRGIDEKYRLGEFYRSGALMKLLRGLDAGQLFALYDIAIHYRGEMALGRQEEQSE